MNDHCACTETYEERWATIPSAHGYEASSLGRVRSIDRRMVRATGYTSRVSGRVLRQSANRGYRYVSLFRKARKVHHLVLEAFGVPRPVGGECRHLNGVRHDNRLENLSWGTSRENQRDKHRHGRVYQLLKTTCPRNHLLQMPNLRPSSLREGKRGCLACARAYPKRKALARQGISRDLQEIADEFYVRIMGAAA